MFTDDTGAIITVINARGIEEHRKIASTLKNDRNYLNYSPFPTCFLNQTQNV